MKQADIIVKTLEMIVYADLEKTAKQLIKNKQAGIFVIYSEEQLNRAAELSRDLKKRCWTAFLKNQVQAKTMSSYIKENRELAEKHKELFNVIHCCYHNWIYLGAQPEDYYKKIAKQLFDNLRRELGE